MFTDTVKAGSMVCKPEEIAIHLLHSANFSSKLTYGGALSYFVEFIGEYIASMAEAEAHIIEQGEYTPIIEFHHYSQPFSSITLWSIIPGFGVWVAPYWPYYEYDRGYQYGNIEDQRRESAWEYKNNPYLNYKC